MQKAETVQIQKYEVEFPQIEDCKRLMAVLSKLTEEPTLKFAPEGLYIRHTDRQDISLVDIFIPSSEFRVYHVDAPVLLTFRIEDFNKLIKAGKKCSLRLSNMEDSEKIRIRYEGREFQLYKMENPAKEQPLPDNIKNDGYFVIPSRKGRPGLIELLKDAESIAPKSFHRAAITFIIANNQVKVKSASDTVKFFSKLTVEDQNLIEARPTDPYEREAITATYAIKDLLQFLASIGYDGPLRVEIGRGRPLRTEFSLGAGKVQYFQAPIILE